MALGLGSEFVGNLVVEQGALDQAQVAHQLPSAIAFLNVALQLTANRIGELGHAAEPDRNQKLES